MTQSAVSVEHTKDTTDLFILKHKDLDVAMMKMDVRTGMIEYILSVYPGRHRAWRMVETARYP